MADRWRWRAADLRADGSWHGSWTEEEYIALMAWATDAAALSIFDDPSLLVEAVGAAPRTLVERANEIRTELIHGRGFAVMSGLDCEAHSREAIAAAFLLFGSLLGSLRSQNAAGDLLGHVIDVGADPADPQVRIYQTNRRQTFHTDSTDAVGLLCLQPARQGGVSMIVSVETVYLRMHELAPQLAARLFEPVATDRRGEQPAGELPWFEIPVLSWSGDRLTVLYQRQYIDSASRFEEAPTPDDEYVQALDLFDQIMNDPEMHFAMIFEPGDMQFVYNHALLHDRTAFVEDPDPDRRRHLLRLWMSLPGDRELPPDFAQRYGTITVGDRGGIVLPETTTQIVTHPRGA